MFLIFRQSESQCSYKQGSYIKKSVYTVLVNERKIIQCQEPSLDAAMHLYERSRPSVRCLVRLFVSQSVCQSVGWYVLLSVCNPFFFFGENDFKIAKNDQETFCNA